MITESLNVNEKTNKMATTKKRKEDEFPDSHFEEAEREFINVKQLVDNIRLTDNVAEKGKIIEENINNIYNNSNFLLPDDDVTICYLDERIPIRCFKHNNGTIHYITHSMNHYFSEKLPVILAYVKQCGDEKTLVVFYLRQLHFLCVHEDLGDFSWSNKIMHKTHKMRNSKSKRTLNKNEKIKTKNLLVDINNKNLMSILRQTNSQSKLAAADILRVKYDMNDEYKILSKSVQTVFQNSFHKSNDNNISFELFQQCEEEQTFETIELYGKLGSTNSDIDPNYYNYYDSDGYNFPFEIRKKISEHIKLIVKDPNFNFHENLALFISTIDLCEKHENDIKISCHHYNDVENCTNNVDDNFSCSCIFININSLTKEETELVSNSFLMNFDNIGLPPSLGVDAVKTIHTHIAEKEETSVLNKEDIPSHKKLNALLNTYSDKSEEDCLLGDLAKRRNLCLSADFWFNAKNDLLMGKVPTKNLSFLLEDSMGAIKIYGNSEQQQQQQQTELSPKCVLFLDSNANSDMLFKIGGKHFHVDLIDNSSLSRTVTLKPYIEKEIEKAEDKLNKLLNSLGKIKKNVKRKIIDEKVSESKKLKNNKENIVTKAGKSKRTNQQNEKSSDESNKIETNIGIKLNCLEQLRKGMIPKLECNQFILQQQFSLKLGDSEEGLRSGRMKYSSYEVIFLPLLKYTSDGSQDDHHNYILIFVTPINRNDNCKFNSYLIGMKFSSFFTGIHSMDLPVSIRSSVEQIKANGIEGTGKKTMAEFCIIITPNVRKITTKVLNVLSIYIEGWGVSLSNKYQNVEITFNTYKVKEVKLLTAQRDISMVEIKGGSMEVNSRLVDIIANTKFNNLPHYTVKTTTKITTSEEFKRLLEIKKSTKLLYKDLIKIVKSIKDNSGPTELDNDTGGEEEVEKNNTLIESINQIGHHSIFQNLVHENDKLKDINDVEQYLRQFMGEQECSGEKDSIKDDEILNKNENVSDVEKYLQQTMEEKECE